ncbi:MAG: hypothetical protein ACRDTZ_00355 [Pseudonocardiaceae bacterium]
MLSRIVGPVGRFGRAVAVAWNTRPTIVTIPLGLIPLGIAAIIIGENASRAFTNLGGGTLVRVLGLAMVVGGVLFAVSVALDDAMYEAMGLSVTTLGVSIYGCGVVFGLGEQGMLAGGGYVLIAIGFLGRIRLLLARARVESGPGP